MSIITGVNIRIDITTNTKYYEAVLYDTLYQYSTDGILNPHITKKQWEDVVLSWCEKHLE